MKNELIVKENPIIAYMQNDGNFLQNALTNFENELMVAFNGSGLLKIAQIILTKVEKDL